MAKDENFALEIYYNESVSYMIFTSFLVTEFSMPDSQADQIFLILRNNKKITLFKNFDKDILLEKSERFEDLGIDNKIIKCYE
jgi:predicted ATP-grasp superfamily ATP-dependent carboligase